MPYGIIETNNKIISEIENNILDIAIRIDENNRTRRKNLEKLTEILKLLIEREINNPFFHDIIEKIKNLLNNIKTLLQVYYNYKSSIGILSKLDQDLIRIINKELFEIKKRIENWIENVRIKSVILDGNSHLINLKIHPMKTRFYVKVMELNPDSTLVLKHPINERQAALQKVRPTKDLFKLDQKDLIKGGRENRKEDDYNYPGSLVIVTQGHHRLYEIYIRYLQGIIDGETLIEFIVDEKFITTRKTARLF